MVLADFIAKYIRQNIAYPTHYVVTKDDFNNILNLLIAQGDYNSEALNDTIVELSAAKEILDSAVLSSDIVGIQMSVDGKLQLTIDGVAWMDVSDTGAYTMLPHTHGNITADGKLLIASEPAVSQFVKTDALGNIVPVSTIAVSEPTPLAIMQRDANGRAQVADPLETQDIVTKNYVDGEISDVTTYINTSIMNADAVGAVKQGLTNPFGVKGALCNGASVRATDYPDLYTVLTGSPTYYTSSWQTATGLSEIEGLLFADDKYILYGTVLVGGLSYTALSFATTMSKTATWTLVQISTAQQTITKLMYVNGNYFAFSANAYVRYSPTLTSTSWTLMGIAANYINSVAYGNGYYVFSGYISSTSDGIVLYQTVLGSTLTVANVGGYLMKGIIFDGTRFVVSVCSAASGNSIKVYSATTPTTWSYLSTITINGTGYFQVAGISLINGNYIIHGFGTGNPSYNWIAYCSTYNGTYLVNLFASVGAVSYTPMGLTHQNGYYIIPHSYSSYLYLYYSTTLAGVFSAIFKANCSPRGEMLWDGNEFFLADATLDGLLQTKFISGDVKLIPVIVDNATVHSYIKTLV